MTPAGFPHSDIHGSIPACGSPWLFAACRVLHRLLAPRHPPYALTNLTLFASLLTGRLRCCRFTSLVDVPLSTPPALSSRRLALEPLIQAAYVNSNHSMRFSTHHDAIARTVWCRLLYTMIMQWFYPLRS